MKNHQCTRVTFFWGLWWLQSITSFAIAYHEKIVSYMFLNHVSSYHPATCVNTGLNCHNNLHYSTSLCIFQHGQTPLHLAAEHDHSDVVKLFLKHRPELVTMANTVCVSPNPATTTHLFRHWSTSGLTAWYLTNARPNCLTRNAMSIWGYFQKYWRQ